MGGMVGEQEVHISVMCGMTTHPALGTITCAKAQSLLLLLRRHPSSLSLTPGACTTTLNEQLSRRKSGEETGR